MGLGVCSRGVKHYFDEVSKTKKYAADWIKSPLEFYHDKLKLLSQYSEEIDSLIEIGCGSSKFLQAVQKTIKIEQLLGIDVSKGMISSVPSTLKRNVIYLLGDALRLPFKANSFDCVCMSDLLHHIIAENRAKSKKGVEATIREVHRVLNPNGFLFFSEIYFESFLASTLTSHIVFSLLAFINKLGIKFPLEETPKNLIVCFYTRSELRQLVRSVGGRILKEQISPHKVGLKERLAFLHRRGEVWFFIQFAT